MFEEGDEPVLHMGHGDAPGGGAEVSGWGAVNSAGCSRLQLRSAHGDFPGSSGSLRDWPGQGRSLLLAITETTAEVATGNAASQRKC